MYFSKFALPLQTSIGRQTKQQQQQQQFQWQKPANPIMLVPIAVPDPESKWGNYPSSSMARGTEKMSSWIYCKKFFEGIKRPIYMILQQL